MGRGEHKITEVSRALRERLALRAGLWSGSNVGSEAHGHCTAVGTPSSHSIPTL